MSGDFGKSSALIYALVRHINKIMGEFRNTKICSEVLASFNPNKLKDVNAAALSYNKFSNQHLAPAQLALSQKSKVKSHQICYSIRLEKI
jgi:hypothetical protein